MSDPYRITEKSTAAPANPGGRVRMLLWLVLWVAAAANVVLSTAVGNLWASSVCGAVALACVAALIIHHYRHRDRRATGVPIA